MSLNQAFAKHFAPMWLAMSLSMPAQSADFGSKGLSSSQSSANVQTPNPTLSGSRGSGQTLWLSAGGDDQAIAQAWGLTLPELRRARELMAGPRGSFSDASISPVEVLGIHASTDGERQKYARLITKITAADSLQVVAWFRALRPEAQALAATVPRQKTAQLIETKPPSSQAKAHALGQVSNNRSPDEKEKAQAQSRSGTGGTWRYP